MPICEFTIENSANGRIFALGNIRTIAIPKICNFNINTCATNKYT